MEVLRDHAAVELHVLRGNRMTQQNRPLASVIEAIGDTPLVELSRLSKGMAGRILAKLDYLNPGFSKKDALRGRSLKMPKKKADSSPARQSWS
jgi:hypothetical protein